MSKTKNQPVAQNAVDETYGQERLRIQQAKMDWAGMKPRTEGSDQDRPAKTDTKINLSKHLRF